ncbi:hypothetical protein IEE_03525 [Bacillus cereus BAG5X1-1]|uniref:DUF1641 domain-containing protein n=1 Tax=Bacillus cereus BAG5X1-1 TaxID=1053189 RepID=J8AJR9_BACCE|nr:MULTISPECIES: DUF1641 domain-containing protein [Bacillus cereus group]EJQ43347.1 hypothetical protein IEE_03525 [Bacillus cereus BAG5X1-1]MDM5461856.1 DUF1641 domain-containing protein [Bacillus cereus]PGY18613.1 DUF1641 domain-containing protein [Bacillus cereus]QWI48970.1 DUF1641 domain-containing protein [Bacillus mycoides]WJE21852.1 DUF1641 domain-containing protein [Bacillus cereus]
MAAPIQAIQKQELTEEELKQQKLEDLKELLANNEDALNQMFNIVGELNDIGMLEAANSMLKAKEPITKIVLGQVTREPVTNLINNMMGVAGALTELNPELTKKLVGSLLTGMDEGNQHLQSNKKVGILDLMKVLKDPDINRAIGFGLHFLKGMGKGLKEE